MFLNFNKDSDSKNSKKEISIIVRCYYLLTIKNNFMNNYNFIIIGTGIVGLAAGIKLLEKFHYVKIELTFLI